MILFLGLLALVSLSRGQVMITKHYDNRDAAVCWMTDDYDKNHIPKAFLDYADLCRSNGIVLGIGVICGFGTPVLISNLQAQIDAGNVEICNHSWDMRSPDVFPTNQILQDVGLSTSYLKTNYTFQTSMHYNGRNYLTAWIQPYGQPVTNAVFLDVIRPILSDMGYLSDRGTLTGQSDFSAWDTMEGLFERWTTRSGSTDLATQLDYLNTVISNKGVFAYYNHCYQPAVTNAMATRTGFHYDFIVQAGNRKNIWYTGPNGLYTYRYTAERGGVTIHYEDGWQSNLIFTVSVPESERDKYGLSYPMTYQCQLPSGWQSEPGVRVFVQWGANGWEVLPEKTTNDFFNGINCYRWNQASNCVYVSYGFPEVGTNFTVRIVSKKISSPKMLNEVCSLFSPVITPDVEWSESLLNQNWRTISVARIQDDVTWEFPPDTSQGFFRIKQLD